MVYEFESGFYGLFIGVVIAGKLETFMSGELSHLIKQSMIPTDTLLVPKWSTSDFDEPVFYS